MATVQFTERAIVDLDDIWSFMATIDQGLADQLIDRLERVFMLLAEQPYIGRARDDLQSGLRSFPVKRYLIFYSKQSQGILVWRVLSARRDIEGMFP